MNRLEHLYEELRHYLDTVPVVDAHEHYFMGTDTRPCDVMGLVSNSYSLNDLESVSLDSARDCQDLIYNESRPLDERLDYFLPLYDRVKHTGYNRAVLRGLQECWGIGEITRDSVHELAEKVSARNNAFFEKMMRDYHIKALVIDPCDNDQKVASMAAGGSLSGYAPECRFTLSLPMYHGDYLNAPRILAERSGCEITCLDEMVAAFSRYMDACMAAGIVALKDQSAYGRTICFDAVDQREAETLFARALKGERLEKGADLRLGNYLIRQYMALAAEKGLPVQMHTGLQAGLCTELTHTKAIHLTSLLNDCRDTHFDLFHGSWPYMDEYLFLGKNYPNVSLDLCWVQSIDPLYSIELMKRAVMVMPTNKLIAFGGDESGIESTVGALCLARDNTARALAELIEGDWLDMEAAKEIAVDWFYRNPNRLLKLGLPEV